MFCRHRLRSRVLGFRSKRPFGNVLWRRGTGWFELGTWTREDRGLGPARAAPQTAGLYRMSELTMLPHLGDVLSGKRGMSWRSAGGSSVTARLDPAPPGGQAGQVGGASDAVAACSGPDAPAPLAMQTGRASRLDVSETGPSPRRPVVTTRWMRVPGDGVLGMEPEWWSPHAATGITCGYVGRSPNVSVRHSLRKASLTSAVRLQGVD